MFNALAAVHPPPLGRDHWADSTAFTKLGTAWPLHSVSELQAQEGSLEGKVFPPEAG